MTTDELGRWQALCPDVDPRWVQAHLTRLEPDYFRSFSEIEICRHLRALSRLHAQHPVEVLVDAGPDGSAVCTILAFDYQGEFSLISGVLAGLGFSVDSGSVYTYAQGPEAEPAAAPIRRPTGRRLPPPSVPPWLRRCIIDRFLGRTAPGQLNEDWGAELGRRLLAVIGLLEEGGPAALRAAKQQVHEQVARRLAESAPAATPVLYPLEITLENTGAGRTRLRVVSEDTPAFLYSLSNALALRGVSIERVSISTAAGRIEDVFEIVDEAGEPIRDPAALDRIKLAVVLTKQFTHFLGQAPDPYAALSRFEQLVDEVLSRPEQGQWLEMFSEPRTLQDLARILGASDFLWEDVIRQQYETLLPILGPHAAGRRALGPAAGIPARLDAALAGAGTPEEQRRRLNEFKDREIFLIDLDHILNPGTDFSELAEHLTVLAEAVVNAAARLAQAALTERFGTPRTVGGLEARWALCGLGKFGGAALGYASDIELMFVYGDNGTTDGPERIENREFFERLARDAAAWVQAKREGIFEVDLRLRPYGSDGPLAVSLESFCSYYGPQGPALAYERLALVRLRAVGGDAELGAQLERLRDEFVYSAGGLDLNELRDLRRKQLEEKTRPGTFNAKFSPGALVDLEYDVQILQVIHGQRHPALRTPRIRQALDALREAGVLAAGEGERLIAAYEFLRRLINGLRMLRGSAQDLFLPAAGSDEHAHLARRLGYVPQAGLSPERQLRLEFETHTAAVRAFVEGHFGRGALPGPAGGNVADLVLSDRLSAEERRAILRQSGFLDPDRADLNLRELTGHAGSRELMARLAVLACDVLAHKPDPDRALNNWERYAGRVPDPRRHFELLLSQPMRLDLLLNIFATSQFLADTLARHPEFFDWVTDPANLRGERDLADLERDLGREVPADAPEPAWLNGLRIFRRREVLRIGTRDLCLRAPLPEVTRDLGTLAEALVRAALARAWSRWGAAARALGSAGPEEFCVLAFGKLGGRELNYSSDIDLLGLYASGGTEGTDPARAELYARVMGTVRDHLSRYTDEGYVYRVDLRLRPYGAEGQLVSSETQVLEYYRDQAGLPEVQALLKLRPIAGDLELGRRVLDLIRPVLVRPHPRAEVVAAVEKMRHSALQQLAARPEPLTDVKQGLGGLRDIEFMVQGLQLLHAAEQAELLTGNTLEALARLAAFRLLPDDVASSLARDYIFLRRVEHHLQILDDQQIHHLPADTAELTALAKRILGRAADAGSFLSVLDQRLREVREAYQVHFLAPVGPA